MDKREKIDKQIKMLLLVMRHLHFRPAMANRHLQALQQLDTLLNLLLIAKLSDIDTYFYTYFKEPSFKVWLLSRLLPQFFSRTSYENRSHGLILEMQERQSGNDLANLKVILGKSFDFIRLLDMMILKLLSMLYLLRDCKEQTLSDLYKYMLTRHKKNELEKLKDKLGANEYNHKMADITNNLHLIFTAEEMSDLQLRKEKIKEILMLEAAKEIVEEKLL